MSQDVFLGILGGIGEAHQANNQNLLTQEVARRKNLAEFWKGMADQPDMRPEARDIATQKYMTIVQTPYDKKLPKGIEAIDDVLNVAPKQGSESWLGGQTKNTMQTAPAPIPSNLDDASERRTPAPTPMTAAAPLPAPPPGYKMPGRFTEEEQIGKARRLGGVQAEMAGQKAFAEKQAEYKALYTPENIAALAQLEQAKRDPLVTVGRGQKVVDTRNGKTVATGLPEEKSVPEQLLDAAAQTVAARHGVTVDPAVGSAFEQLPTPSMKAEAALERAMMDESTTDKEIKQLNLQHARLLNSETKLRIDQLLKENDPETFGKIADLVHDNPDALFNYSPKDIRNISDAMITKGYPVPRKPLPATQQTQVSNAELVQQHVAAIRNLLKQYPDMVGPVAGRVGLSEETWGAPVFNDRKDPERASVEQELRTRMKYLIAQDLRALVGARPAASWLQELKNSSPNPRQALSFLEGSLRGVEGSAKLVLDTAYRDRYGTQASATGRPGAPTPPPGVTPTSPAATTVRMSLDGQLYDVPKEKVAEAKARGAVEVK